MRIRNLIVIATLIISFLIMTNVLLAVPGTYQVFSGNGDWFVERTYPTPAGPKIAELVDTPVIWDNTMGFDPVPWSRLYEREEACWISWTSLGLDSIGAGELYRYYSPPFKIYDNISRATIWFSVDDLLYRIYLRNLEDSTLVSTGILDTNTRYYHLARYDITEVVRSCSNGSIDPLYQLEIEIENTSQSYTGIIVYFSYDYIYYGYSPYAYSYRFPSGAGVYEFSMPFYPAEDDISLSELFDDEITAAWVYDSSTGDLTQSIDIDEPLTGSTAGSLADSLRTFSLKASFIDGHSIYYSMYGYPIFEQRYLDLRGNNTLWMGSVNCDVPFSGSSPYDYPDSIFFGDWTDEYRDANGYNMDSLTNSIQPRLAYRATPISPDSTYNLDLDCGYGHSASAIVMEEGLTTIFYGHSEELMAELRELASNSIDLPETTTLSSEKLISAQTPKPNEFNVITYPTPFNSSVNLRILLPNESSLSIIVYNVKGEIVRELYSGFGKQGLNTFSWDSYDQKGNSAPGGVYLISTKYSNTAIVEKVILIK